MKESIFDLLLEQAPVGFTRVDLDGRITFANKSARKTLDIPDDVDQFYYNDEKLGIVDIDRSPLPEGKYPFIIVSESKAPQYGMEMAFQREGDLKIIEVDGCPVFNESNTILEYVFIFHDITKDYEGKRSLIASIQRCRDSLSCHL